MPLTMREVLEKALHGGYGGHLDLDLPHLIRMAVLMEHDGVSANAAAKRIGDEIGSGASGRHAVRKRLYGKFQKAAPLYRRLSLLPFKPGDFECFALMGCAAAGTLRQRTWSATFFDNTGRNGPQKPR